MNVRVFRSVVVAMLTVADLGAGSPPPSQAPAVPTTRIQLTCTSSSYLVANLGYSGALIAPVAALVSANDSVPMVALDDLVNFDRAKSAIDGDRVSLTVSNPQHTLVFFRSSATVTLDGKPAEPIKALPVLWRGRLYIDAQLARIVSDDPTEFNFATLDAIPKQADGRPQTVPPECAPKLSAAQAAILASSQIHFPKRATPTLWCEPSHLDGSDLNGLPLEAARSLALTVRANRELCNGNYTPAAADLVALKRKVVADGSKLIDFQRRYVLAQSLGGAPELANAMLEGIAPLTGDGAKPIRALWAKDYCASIRGFVAEDAQRQMTPDERDAYKAAGPDPALAKAADAECAGHTDAAIAAIVPPASHGVALYELILGNLYAQQSDWQRAASAWWTAASDYPDTPSPEYANFDTFNPQALWMIYYYRSHMPR